MSIWEGFCIFLFYSLTFVFILHSDGNEKRPFNVCITTVAQMPTVRVGIEKHYEVALKKSHLTCLNVCCIKCVDSLKD